MSWLLPLILLGRVLAAGDPLPTITTEAIATPARGAASGAALCRAPDGTVWLTWLEPAGGETALRCSTFDAGSRRWREPRTVAQGRDWFVNAADVPTLAVGENGTAMAAWYVKAEASARPADDEPVYHAMISRTPDGGKTWTQGVPLSRESDAVQFVSLATLEDGRTLAAWIDGRERKTGRPQQLRARVIGSDAPDTLVDASVCDCCATALTTFPDGTALVAYRGRTDAEIRDIRISRFRGGRWDEPRTLNRDDWKIPGCPVNGPRLASDGGRVAVAWFTAAADDPRVLASFSSDAGARFLMPLRVDHVKPAGHVDTLLLRDGAMLVTWVAANGDLWLRRISPEYAAEETVLLGPAAVRRGGFPRAVLLRDYQGGKTTAQLLVAFTARDGTLQTVMAAVPEGDLLEAGRNCDCAPTAEQLAGFSMRGTLVAVKPDAGVARVSHFELPGIFAAGTRDFKVAPGILPALQPGRQFFGRIQKRDGAWWLYDIRYIATPIP